MLSLFVVYQYPIDFPNEYAVREWIMKQHVTSIKEVAGEIIFKDQDLGNVREFLGKKGLYRMDRSVNDDPFIFETWV